MKYVLGRCLVVYICISLSAGPINIAAGLMIHLFRQLSSAELHPLAEKIEKHF